MGIDFGNEPGFQIIIFRQTLDQYFSGTWWLRSKSTADPPF